jgi:hypothetical protein
MKKDRCIILEGYLDRYGMLRDWKPRYVELTDDSLCYFRTKGKIIGELIVHLKYDL